VSATRKRLVGAAIGATAAGVLVAIFFLFPERPPGDRARATPRQDAAASGDGARR
jgi:hypothetical protein